MAEEGYGKSGAGYPVGWVASGNRANSLMNPLIHWTVSATCSVILRRSREKRPVTLMSTKRTRLALAWCRVSSGQACLTATIMLYAMHAMRNQAGGGGPRLSGGVGPKFRAGKLAAAQPVFDFVVDVFDRAGFLAMPREQFATVFVPAVGEDGVVMFVVAVGEKVTLRLK